METTGMRLLLAPPLLIIIMVISALTAIGQRMPIPVQRPLCTSQYALANYACSRLPILPNPPLPPLTPPPAPVDPPPSPPAPPSPDDDDDDEHGEHHHHHHHGHKHRHHSHRRHRSHRVEHRESFAEAECCKWLKQMDNECVCDLLVHLPPLLARPVHNYTVFVDESCIVTFICGGRFIR
ncbi:PREDICTED: lysine-rich arabinogalactan protein 19-like [Tarenaya hassleriana]|uniref:lysine-rich arabinogalactan protein 19-like n=1 Tax=Tarenaya hassleriana TaxID=28532 RepID=UPI00053C37CD|nr:PREDICTED: lysine-rich arabinogalactan protein 19-like [Tarenaya hassleriana]